MLFASTPRPALMCHTPRGHDVSHSPHEAFLQEGVTHHETSMCACDAAWPTRKARRGANRGECMNAGVNGASHRKPLRRHELRQYKLHACVNSIPHNCGRIYRAGALHTSAGGFQVQGLRPGE